MKKLKIMFVLFVAVLITAVLLCPVTAFAEEEPEEKKQVTISFNSMGGSKCEPIYGYAGETVITKDTLPIPVKEGYAFIEWRFFNEYGVTFDLEVFPNFDVKLVAAFEKIGFSTTFEEGLSEIHDIASGIELYAPDTKDYLQSSVKSGWRCLKTKGVIGSNKFLLSYANELEAGKEYELVMWLKTENNSAKGTVEFLYTKNPDVRDEVIGAYEAFDLKNMKKGEWQEYRVKFVAAEPYIVVKLPGVSNLYIDEITVVPTGVLGEIPELKAYLNTGVILIVTAVLAAIGLTAVVIVLKCKK